MAKYIAFIRGINVCNYPQLGHDARSRAAGIVKRI
jgi:uncharacterized protein (DUF1697 family)